jgi:hypothetical protein
LYKGFNKRFVYGVQADGLRGINMAEIVRRSVRETVREANGRWIKGYQPEGAHSFPPGNNANPADAPAAIRSPKPIKAA